MTGARADEVPAAFGSIVSELPAAGFMAGVALTFVGTELSEFEATSGNALDAETAAVAGPLPLLMTDSEVRSPYWFFDKDGTFSGFGFRNEEVVVRGIEMSRKLRI
jgi:hypothetical protein